MKTQLLILVALIALVSASRAEPAAHFLLAPGVACQPTTAADAAKLDYSDGSARNIYPAPGTSAQIATVVCQLPAVPPTYRPVQAGVYYLDADRRWGKCYFHNLLPTLAPESVLVVDVPSRPGLGVASLGIDSTRFVPHAVRCFVRPGQTVYAVQLDLAP